MTLPITQAQPPLEFIPPNFNPLVLQAMHWLLPSLVRWTTHITEVEAKNVEVLVDLYRQFQAGKIRFLIAFRHPSVDDPFCLANLLSQQVPPVARQQKVALQQPIHAHFIYDRGIPLWAGSQVAWLYSQLGGTPIHRGKIDRAGLRSIRELFTNGRFPILASPEGATNGHNEVISPLEPGIAQMGFWCQEDLIKAGRSETVLIVPIGIQYRYIEAPWQALETLLGQLEADAGFTGQQDGGSSPEYAARSQDLQGREAALYRRLYRLGEHLLTLMEEFYKRFYPQISAIPVISTSPSAPSATPRSDQEFADRLQALLDTALKVAEQYFDLQPKGSVIDRCRRLEQAGWDRIYREDLKNIDTLSPIERGLADRIAEEANLRMWHMRLVESFVAVTGKYVLEKPTAERFADTTLLMWDMMARIKGNSPFQRPRLGRRKAYLTIGTPISVSDRWDTYQSSRRVAKQAIAELTQDLQDALTSMIV